MKGEEKAIISQKGKGQITRDKKEKKDQLVNKKSYGGKKEANATGFESQGMLGQNSNGPVETQVEGMQAADMEINMGLNEISFGTKLDKQREGVGGQCYSRPKGGNHEEAVTSQAIEHHLNKALATRDQVKYSNENYLDRPPDLLKEDAE